MQNSQSYEFLNVGDFWPKTSDLLHLVTTYFKRLYSSCNGFAVTDLEMSNTYRKKNNFNRTKKTILSCHS